MAPIVHSGDRRAQAAARATYHRWERSECMHNSQGEAAGPRIDITSKPKGVIVHVDEVLDKMWDNYARPIPRLNTSGRWATVRPSSAGSAATPRVQ